jgi:hypothetical protein
VQCWYNYRTFTVGIIVTAWAFTWIFAAIFATVTVGIIVATWAFAWIFATFDATDTAFYTITAVVTFIYIAAVETVVAIFTGAEVCAFVIAIGAAAPVATRSRIYDSNRSICTAS